MKIKSLVMNNFRGINSLSLEFNQTGPTVLIGINGVGKSSILDCLSIFLSLFFIISTKNNLIRDLEHELQNHKIKNNFEENDKFIKNKSSSKDKRDFDSRFIWRRTIRNNEDELDFSLSDQDITNGFKETNNEIVISCIENNYFPNKKYLSKNLKNNNDIPSNSSSNIQESHDFQIFADKKTKEDLENPLGRNLETVIKNIENLEVFLYAKEPQKPLLIYYPVNRLLDEISLEINDNQSLEQVDGYDYPLSSRHITFKNFFEWFRNREDLENEELRDNPKHRDTQLQAVRSAISEIVPSFSNLRVRRRPLRMTVTKESQELIINQLSDGEKCLLAMVGDLARRLAITSPNLDNPLLGNGIVLIDEIEQHLHPGWQYEIIPALTRTFPNCQFIVTTHSPIVLSQVKPEGIFCLEKRDGKVIAYHPDSSYGRDSNRILEDLMGVPERPQVFKDRLRELFRFIDEGNLDKAKELQHQLEESIGSDEPEFARADVLIRRQEILGR
jgi:predicted ATP-binding protein involved in virulence